MLANLIVEILVAAISAVIVAVICTPFAFLFSLGIKREYSPNFWFRTIVLSQLLFWGALILDMSASSYGYFKGPEDVIPVVFGFIISIPATALLIRTCMRRRKSKTAAISGSEDPKDRLDSTFEALEEVHSAAEGIEKTLQK